MPLTHVILDNASLKLGADEATLTELACYTNHLELTPDVSTTTVDTMCGSIDYPGAVKWSLVATLIQSFDTDGPEDVLSGVVTAGTPCAFEVVADKVAVISATNPAWSGTVIPKPYSPLNGDAGAASEISLEWGLVGEPVKRITATLAAAAASASSGGGSK